MQPPIPFRTDLHRTTSLWRFRCHADSRFFMDEAQMPEAMRADLEAHNGLPCGDGVAGEPGPWCAACRFGEAEDLYLIANGGITTP